MIQTDQRATSTHEPSSTHPTSLNGGASPPDHVALHAAPSTGGKRPTSKGRKLVKLIVFVFVAGGTTAAAWAYPKPFLDAWSALTKPKAHETDHAPAQFQPPSVSSDGILTLGEKAVRGMGLETVKVVPQTEPIRLELLGTTEYDSDNQTRIRPLFKGRVDKVYAKVGQLIKKGEPLIEFYSTALAEAKNACEIERIQWVFCNNLLKVREKLSKENAISKQSFLEAQNDEMKNLREYEVARDKLLVYGLSEEEVAKVKDEVGSQKARMTFRSPATGIVITRDVVPGNIYDDDDTLLVIEPLDHLWVWGNVFESDLDLVKLGQSWEIQFPFQTERLHGKVEYISNNVDPGTHAVRVRTSIANNEGRIKSDMLVRGTLEIAPNPNFTVIPRTSLVVNAGLFYAFVKVPGSSAQYRRVPVKVAQEKDDHVVIESGLKTGDEIVNVGALFLDQMFDNAQVTRAPVVTNTAPEPNGVDDETSSSSHPSPSGVEGHIPRQPAEANSR
jgi:cobalt-zinc-cadmium efflux system membrane fusion protein